MFVRVSHECDFRFDRHMMNNHGIELYGFAGDTMHMARLWNSSRRSYSLETLSEELLVDTQPKVGMKVARR